MNPQIKQMLIAEFVKLTGRQPTKDELVNMEQDTVLMQRVILKILGMILKNIPLLNSTFNF